MKKSISFTLMLIVFTMHACIFEKEKYPYLSTNVEGIITDRRSNLPIPFAKVDLMELKTENGSGISPSEFSNWNLIDQTTADEEGNYHFNYEGRRIYRYGIYVKSERYYETGIPHMFFSDETLLNSSLLPKSYLRVHLVDSPPYRSFDSLWLLTTTYESFPTIFNWSVDTTVIAPLTPDEQRIIQTVFWENGVNTRDHFGVNCPALDTCDLEIIY